MNDDQSQIQNPIPSQSLPIQSSGLTQTQPVSAKVGKESESIDIQKPQEQWIQETAPTPVIAEEVEKAGVEVTKGEVLEVPPDVAQAGVVTTGTATPLPANPTLKFPMTEEKAKEFLGFHKKVKESITWLAMLVVRQMQMLQTQQNKNKKDGVKEVVA